jgi:hypothetical protein
VREIVSPEQLLTILNRELDRHRECRGARFTASVLAPREPDPSGCNWNREDIYLSTSGSMSTRCWGRARQILREAEARYNLED